MLDWQSFLKLDNAATIDFLSSYASALSSETLIDDRAVDKFKVSLASITPLLSSTQSSVLTLLSELDSEFLHIMVARYGHSGMAWNHMRSSTRNLLSESCANLAAWADCALKKAELFMNRSYIATPVVGRSRRELFPTVLFHTAKSLHDAAKELREVILDLSTMRPADVLDTSGEQYDKEHRIALQVGFSGLEQESIAYCRRELRSLRKIVTTFDELAESLPTLISGLADNTASSSMSKKLQTECEIFSAECQRLSGVKFELSPNLSVWETRRLGFLFELFSINHRMTQLTKLFADSFAPKDKLSTLDLLTDDLERAVTCNLIQRGTPAKDAAKASMDLIRYCRHHHTTPSTLIPAELKKINPNLHDDTLSFAATLSSQELLTTPGGSAEKTRFFEAAKQMRKSLNLASPFSVSMALLLCSFFVGSCGVKTPLVTDAVDARPKIPFHTVTDAPTKEPEKDAPKTNQDRP